jgi:hypothetical protein
MKNKIWVASACVALAVLGNSTGWAQSCAIDGTLPYVCIGDESGSASWVAVIFEESAWDSGVMTVSSTANTCDGTSAVKLWNGSSGSPFGNDSVTYFPPVPSVTDDRNTVASGRGICFIAEVSTSGTFLGVFRKAYVSS